MMSPSVNDSFLFRIGTFFFLHYMPASIVSFLHRFNDATRFYTPVNAFFVAIYAVTQVFQLNFYR